MPQTSQDFELLRAALIGFDHQREEVEQKIAELRRLLGGQSSRVTSADGHVGRTLSAAARARIASAQRKRWAAYKAQQGKGPAAKPKKRVRSAAGRARIVAATKKRWAEYRKAKTS